MIFTENLYSMIWRTTSWCQIIFKWSKGDWNTSSMFRTFPKMLKCFQNRSKQTVVKSAKSPKLENTLVSLKTQIPARQWSKRNVTEVASNEIPSILDILSSSKVQNLNEYRCQMQYHWSIIQWTIVPNRGVQRSNPAYIVKKHDGPIPYIHKEYWRTGVDRKPGNSC